MTVFLFSLFVNDVIVLLLFVSLLMCRFSRWKRWTIHRFTAIRYRLSDTTVYGSVGVRYIDEWCRGRRWCLLYPFLQCDYEECCVVCLLQKKN